MSGVPQRSKDRWFRIPVPRKGVAMTWSRAELGPMIQEEYPPFRWFVRDFNNLEIILILDPEVVHKEAYGGA